MNNLAINFKTNISNFETLGIDIDDVYAKFMVGDKEYIVRDYTIENGTTPRYVFQLANIAAHQMNEQVFATLVTEKDGVVYESTPLEYGIEFYAYNQLSKDTTAANIKTLLVDLLNYGAAAQLYKNKSTPADQLATRRLTDEWKALGNTALSTPAENITDAFYKTVENPTVTMKGASLRLDTAVEIRLKFAAESVEGLVMKVVTGGKTYTVTEFTDNGDGTYYAYFAGLNAHQMRQAVDMTIMNGDTAVSNTVRYSIASYVAKYQTSTNANLVNLIKSMLIYGDSAYSAK